MKAKMVIRMVLIYLVSCAVSAQSIDIEDACKTENIAPYVLDENMSRVGESFGGRMNIVCWYEVDHSIDNPKNKSVEFEVFCPIGYGVDVPNYFLGVKDGDVGTPVLIQKIAVIDSEGIEKSTFKVKPAPGRPHEHFYYFGALCAEKN